MSIKFDYTVSGYIERDVATVNEFEGPYRHCNCIIYNKNLRLKLIILKRLVETTYIDNSKANEIKIGILHNF